MLPSDISPRRLLLAGLALGLCAGALGFSRLEAQDAPARADWRWDAALTEEQVAELTPLRDRWLDELEALGPTPEERLAAIRLSREEELALRDRIDAMDYQRRRGSALVIRDVRTQQVTDAFGVRAIPILTEAVGSGPYWSARQSAEAIGGLCDGPQHEEARWLAFQLQSPEAMIALFGTGPESDLVGLNFALDQALRSTLDRDPVEVVELETRASADRARAQAMQAQDAWSRTWTEAHRAWHDEEKLKEGARRELTKKLDLVRRGALPHDAGR